MSDKSNDYNLLCVNPLHVQICGNAHAVILIQMCLTHAYNNYEQKALGVTWEILKAHEWLHVCMSTGLLSSLAQSRPAFTSMYLLGVLVRITARDIRSFSLCPLLLF